MRKLVFILLCWLFSTAIAVLCAVRLLDIAKLETFAFRLSISILAIVSLILNAAAFRPSADEGLGPANQLHRLIHAIVSIILVFVAFRYLSKL